MSSRRLRRLNSMNWVIERWVDPTEKKKAKKGEWVIDGYFPTLASAAVRMLDDEIGDGWTGQDVVNHLEGATERVLEATKHWST